MAAKIGSMDVVELSSHANPSMKPIGNDAEHHKNRREQIGDQPDILPDEEHAFAKEIVIDWQGKCDRGQSQAHEALLNELFLQAGCPDL